MDKLLQDGKDLKNTYFSESFKHYPTLAIKRRTCTMLLFLFVIFPFISLLILRSQYESVTGTNYQSIFDKVLYIMIVSFCIFLPILMNIEKKINNVLLSPTHHLVYSKCELKRMLSTIETSKDININTNDELYHELKKLLSLIEQYSLAYMTTINTHNIKNMNFSLSLNELEKQISHEVYQLLETPKERSKLEELEFEIKQSNVKCFESFNHYKLGNLTEKCFKEKVLGINEESATTTPQTSIIKY